MFGFSFYKGLDGLKFTQPSRNMKPVKVDVKKQIESVLDLIYSADSNTGYPSGALGHYFSDKVSPEVRIFIEQELFGKELPETAPMFGSSQVREVLRDMDDSFLIETLPKHTETSEEYADRMKSYIENIKKQSDYDKRVVKWRKSLGFDEDDISSDK